MINNIKGDTMEIIFSAFFIFLARILDVSIGSIRIIFLSRGNSKLASSLAFFEMLVWFLIARDALENSNNIIIVIGYCLGYAVGTFVGSILSEKFINEIYGIQVVTSKILVKELKSRGYGVTNVKVDNNKYMLFIQTDKNKMKELYQVINKYDKKAFISVNNTKRVINGYFSK